MISKKKLTLKSSKIGHRNHPLYIINKLNIEFAIEREEFIILKNKTLYALNNNHASKELINELILIDNEKSLTNFIANKLKSIVTIEKIKQTRTSSKKLKKATKIGDTFEVYKKKLINQLRIRGADPDCLKMLESKKDKNSIADYIRKFLRDEVNFLEMKGFQIKLIETPPAKRIKVEKEKKKEYGWINIISTPMGNKR